MARPKKPEERNRIRDVAFNVFSTRGFENASFSDIAKQASVSKSLVQYYFPKKEQFISDFIDKSLSSVVQIVREDLDLKTNHELGELYAIGYAQFYFAMYNEKMNSLRMDIIRDRGNTELFVKYGIDWIIDHTDALQVYTPEQNIAYRKTLIFVVGGVFDYLYDCMANGMEFDTTFISNTALTILQPFLLEPFTEGDSIREQMPPEWLEKARKKYNRMIFTIK